MAGDKPPRFLPVPELGLRIELSGLVLEKFPEDIRRKCFQLYDDERFDAQMWVFGKAKDAAKTYYVLSGYFKWRKLMADRRPYELSDWVISVQGDKCGGDPNAAETFDVRDPDAENTGNVPIPILRQLAFDLAARTVKAFGGTDKLRAAIISQRVDFDSLSPELQEAFKPYFPAASR
jgi:hypothetical protein